MQKKSNQDIRLVQIGASPTIKIFTILNLRRLYSYISVSGVDYTTLYTNEIYMVHYFDAKIFLKGLQIVRKAIKIFSGKKIDNSNFIQAFNFL